MGHTCAVNCTTGAALIFLGFCLVPGMTFAASSGDTHDTVEKAIPQGNEHALASLQTWLCRCLPREVLRLPQKLMAEAKANRKAKPYRAAVTAQLAVAILILIRAPIRSVAPTWSRPS